MVCGCASSFGCPLGSNAFSRTIGGRERVPVAKHPPKVRPLLPLLTMGIIMDPSALGLAGAVLVATQPSPAALPGGQLGRVTHRPPCPQVSTPAAAGSSSRCLPTLFRPPPTREPRRTVEYGHATILSASKRADRHTDTPRGLLSCTTRAPRPQTTETDYPERRYRPLVAHPTATDSPFCTRAAHRRVGSSTSKPVTRAETAGVKWSMTTMKVPLRQTSRNSP